MLVKDEATVANHAKQLLVEERRAKEIAWAANIMANGKVLLDPETDPTVLQRQMGKSMTTFELEQKLKKLNPRFRFEEIDMGDGTIHKTCKRLTFCYASHKETVCVYSIGQIPEFSLHKVNIEEVPDFALKSISRKDLPDFHAGTVEVETDKKSPNYGDVRGEGYTWRGAIPGIKKVKVPGSELVRGWRTVLARIVGSGFATPTEVEKIFGSCDKLSWAAYMGKTSDKPLM